MKNLLLILLTCTMTFGMVNCGGDNCDAVVAHFCDECSESQCEDAEEALDDAQTKDSYECNVSDGELEDYEKLSKSDGICG